MKFRNRLMIKNVRKKRRNKEIWRKIVNMKRRSLKILKE
jgi:hypothetical protein